MSKQTPPPRNLEIGIQPAVSVNWKGIAMLAMIPVIAAGFGIAHKYGNDNPVLLYVGWGIGGIAVLALIIMKLAGFNPPTDYAAEGRAQREAQAKREA